jgi:predicted oxidoreductase (fatty acid repression mutant protein)
MTIAAKTTKATADSLLELVKVRRSIYTLNKNLPVAASRIRHIVEQATLHTPSSFNSQTNRVLVLLGAHHDKFWNDILPGVLKAKLDAERFARAEGRLPIFAGAAGTVLFFDDVDTIKATGEKFPMIANTIEPWAGQSVAMQQWITWTALELEGMGANLQHYGPEIDSALAAEWKIPAGWRSNAQLVFGGIAEGAELKEKEFKPLEERVSFFE